MNSRVRTVHSRGRIQRRKEKRGSEVRCCLFVFWTKLLMHTTIGSRRIGSDQWSMSPDRFQELSRLTLPHKTERRERGGCFYLVSLANECNPDPDYPVQWSNVRTRRMDPKEKRVTNVLQVTDEVQFTSSRVLSLRLPSLLLVSDLSFAFFPLLSEFWPNVYRRTSPPFFCLFSARNKFPPSIHSSFLPSCHSTKIHI